MNRSQRSSTKRIGKALARSRGGNAAVEFSLILPVLAMMLVGIIDVGTIAYQRTDMFSAIRAGAQYFMAGGSDFERAAELVRSSWTEAPSDALVSVDRYCECQRAANACSEPCPDGSAPDAYARITISARVEGLLKEYGALVSDVIRVR